MERSGNPERNKIGIGQACEFHDPHPIDELWQQAPGDLEAQTRLADTSGTRQGDEAAGGGEAEDLLERDGAADQFGNRLRQVRRWTCRLFSSTTWFGQTRSISASLLTTAPDASISAISTSKARPPRWIGRLSARSSRRCGKTLKRPNSIAAGVSDRGSMSAIVARIFRYFQGF